MDNFKDKKILITGASKGLGMEIATEFEKLGAKLILIARSKELLDKLTTNFNDKKKHLVYAKDLLEENNLEVVLNDIEDKLSNIDVIIHCLGGSFGINDPLDNWKSFERSLRGNLGIALDINRRFIPKMEKNKQGNIIHISSLVSQQATASPFYCAAKSALSGYVRSMGNHLVKMNIYLSCIVPGAFIADNNAMSRFKFYKPKEYEKFVSELPQKEMPHAKEYLDLVKILSGKKARVFAGSLINMDGGQGLSIFHG
jgi:short-subunit dehydrogenase